MLKSDTILRTCCVCGTDGDGSSAVEGFGSYDVRQCVTCGLTYLGETVDQGEFVDAARDGLDDGEEKKVEYWSFPKLYDRHREVFDGFAAQRLERLRDAVPALRSVLDAGCGYGFFANYVRQAGVRVAGMDIVEECVDYARSTFGLDVTWCEFGLYETANRFDAIVACDVLEHVDDPASFLTKCRKLLNDGGVVYLQVPNVVVGTIPAGGSYNWPFHVWQFTPETLRKLLENNGYEIVNWWTGVMGVIGVYESGGPTPEDLALWRHAEDHRCGNRLQMLARPMTEGKR